MTLLVPTDRARRILALALPILGGMVSQNLLNLVDTAMVGTLGDAAIAAVGLGGFANFLATAFITGLAAGVQAMSARRLGEGRLSETAIPLNGGMLLAIGIAVPWSLLGIALTPALYPWLNADPAVAVDGVPYLQWRLVGAAALGANYAFRGYWSGVNRTGNYLATLIAMHASNVVLNWLLIFGNLGFPELGAVGSGVSTTIATFLGTGIYVALGWREARGAGFLAGLPSWETMRTMLRLSVPAALQNTFFAAGITVQMWIIGRVGTAELSAATVLINLSLLAILPGMALGISAASLVGQALGRGDAGDAARWGWDVTRLAIVLLGLLGLPLVLAPDPILAPFLHDPATLALAREPLRMTGALLSLDAVGLVLLNALFGAGDSRSVMRVSVAMQWGFGLPAMFVAGPVLGYGLLTLWAFWLGYRVIQSAWLAALWRRGEWAAVRA